MKNRLLLLPGGRRLLVLAVPVLLGAGTLVAAYAYTNATTTTASPHTPAFAAINVPPPAGLLVDVVGAVNHPGLYRMKRGDRVYDAISAAGGLSPLADPARLPNLAGRLKDGEQIKVPFARSSPGSLVYTRVNLNTATIDELVVVPGFTVYMAQEVIDYRINFGGFQNTRELVEVLGMSEADFVIARRYLTL